MSWYDNTLSVLEPGKTYSRSALMDRMKEENPALGRNSFQWAVGSMLQSGKLVRTEFDGYMLPGAPRLPAYTPGYTGAASELSARVAEKFPYIRFTVFETSLLNEFLGHLIAQDTIFLQVEKEAAVFVFRYLQEEGYRNLMYRPSVKDFGLYWAKDCIVVTDMVSEAPLVPGSPHSISLEKMLVDIYCDRLIASIFGRAEYPSVVEQAAGRYRVEKQKLLRYAARRNRKDELEAYFKDIG